MAEYEIYFPYCGKQYPSMTRPLLRLRIRLNTYTWATCTCPLKPEILNINNCGNTCVAYREKQKTCITYNTRRKTHASPDIKNRRNEKDNIHDQQYQKHTRQIKRIDPDAILRGPKESRKLIYIKKQKQDKQRLQNMRMQT